MMSSVIVERRSRAGQLSELVGEGTLSAEYRYQLAALLATIAGSVQAISLAEQLDLSDPAFVASCWRPVEKEYRELLAAVQ